jgi:hypothetical protein
MNYKDINDKWKMFLTENAFKEDIVIKPEKDKKKKKKGKKEIIVSEDDLTEFEEFEEAVINEPSGAEGYDDKSLEEMSAMSGGAVQGYAGNAFAPKKKIKPY